MKKVLPFLFLVVSFAASAQTWTKTTAPDSILYVGIRTWGEDTIYAWGLSPSSPIYPNTLVSSFDGGQTWTVGPWSRYNSDQVVATPAGLYVSYYNYLSTPWSGHLDYTNNGTSWQTVPGSNLGDGSRYKPLGVLTNGKLLLANSTNGKLNVSPDYVSLGTDYGTLYQYRDDYTYYATNPNTGRIIFGRNSGSEHMAYTDDNGVNFTDISLVSLVGNTYSPIVRYAKDNTFFNARMWGVQVSTDNGNTWALCNNAAIGGSISDMQVNSDGQVIVTRSDNQIMSSGDNGQSWTAMNTGLPSGFGASVIGNTANGKFWLPLYGNQPTNGGIYVIESGGATNGMNENEAQKISVSPNPASDYLTISWEGASVIQSCKVSAVDGQLFNLEFDGKELHIASLPAGVYFAELQFEQAIQRVKFIKK